MVNIGTRAVRAESLEQPPRAVVSVSQSRSNGYGLPLVHAYSNEVAGGRWSPPPNVTTRSALFGETMITESGLATDRDPLNPSTHGYRQATRRGLRWVRRLRDLRLEG
jgi:hypothetical protein